MFHTLLWFILITEYLEPKRKKVECSAIWEDDAKWIFRSWLTLHCSSKVQITSKSSHKKLSRRLHVLESFPSRHDSGRTFVKPWSQKHLTTRLKTHLVPNWYLPKRTITYSNTSYCNIFDFVSYHNVFLLHKNQKKTHPSPLSPCSSGRKPFHRPPFRSPATSSKHRNSNSSVKCSEIQKPRRWIFGVFVVPLSRKG